MAPIDEERRESHLGWCSYIQRKKINAQVRERINSSWGSQKKGREKLKIKLINVTKMTCQLGKYPR